MLNVTRALKARTRLGIKWVVTEAKCRIDGSGTKWIAMGAGSTWLSEFEQA